MNQQFEEFREQIQSVNVSEDNQFIFDLMSNNSHSSCFPDVHESSILTCFNTKENISVNLNNSAFSVKLLHLRIRRAEISNIDFFKLFF